MKLLSNTTIMQHITTFYENLGNKDTTMLVGFLTGFIIGINYTPFIAVIVGIVFAIIALILWSILEMFYPNNISLQVNLKPLITIAILILFFMVTSSTTTIDKIRELLHLQN